MWSRPADRTGRNGSRWAGTGSSPPIRRRRRAALIIARVKAGEAPVPEPMAAKPEGGPTVAELAARYLKEHVVLRFSGRTTTPDTTNHA